jgi:sterol desaturase/sphingolipid hydroxylase (fatty acid hydroxylase superfamily)
MKRFYTNSGSGGLANLSFMRGAWQIQGAWQRMSGRVRKFLVGYRGWRDNARLSDGMTLTDLLHAYASFPTIQLNLALAAAALGVTASYYDSWPPLLLIAALAVLIYSVVEYVFHRFILHARWLYRFKSTAAFWKRVHYDHHQDASDLTVMFGDPRTTLPPILIIAAAPGYLIDGVAGAAFAVFCGIALTSIYELFHLYQHVPYEPRSAYLRRLKKRHLAHHFHNETGNFGITSHVWDAVFGTNYDSVRERPRSSSVRHLGYADDETKRFPWVMQLSDTRTRR